MILPGQRYNRLTVLVGGNTNDKLLCRCSCGIEKRIKGTHLKEGRTKSCGCLRSQVTIERSLIHGLTPRDGKHPLANIWNNIRDRCTNKKNESYHNYGGRGIILQASWMNDMEAFVNYCKSLPDYDKRQTLNLTLDRIDNNGNYVEGNLRWATYQEQRWNQR